MSDLSKRLEAAAPVMQPEHARGDHDRNPSAICVVCLTGKGFLL